MRVAHNSPNANKYYRSKKIIKHTNKDKILHLLQQGKNNNNYTSHKWLLHCQIYMKKY